ncbi:putative ring finger protein [Tripterygium wilfordii]|uniref:RING-type E3 ubiquitin transferase n=1 Tax=Tripterygium wilfordii TaxID=458696 RepID=A0A7J7CLR0_TRIWF|nr:RING-H2 finger protein ATL20-like [Tripterygium wilfordii]KAF5735000.1 putative ring finger protein [Tripterygium wilfordii]
MNRREFKPRTKPYILLSSLPRSPMAPFELCIFFLFLLSFIQISIGVEDCQSVCDGNIFGGNPVVRFPFQFKTGSKTSRCGFPGFDLACDKNGFSILTLPHAGQFVVEYIDYRSQSIWFNDPGFCLPKRLLDSSFNLSDTPFIEEYNRYFTFLNCSDSSDGSNSQMILPQSRYLSCLSQENYTAWALPTDVYESQGAIYPSCTVISKTVYVPVPWLRWTDLSAGSRLLWVEPDCKECEEAGGTCGFAGDSGLDIGCFNLPKDGGIPRSAKYGIAIGIGIPGLLCLIGLVGYLYGRVKSYSQRHRAVSTEFSSSIAPQPVIIVSGLDGQTIEKFPKTLLGESRRLPRPGDNTCPICLAEYQPKETIRTIPECNHYFHAVCIDEWLRMNPTCPLCRKSPDSSSRITPSCSASSSSTSLPSSP